MVQIVHVSNSVTRTIGEVGVKKFAINISNQSPLKKMSLEFTNPHLGMKGKIFTRCIFQYKLQSHMTTLSDLEYKPLLIFRVCAYITLLYQILFLSKNKLHLSTFVIPNHLLPNRVYMFIYKSVI